MTTVARQLTNSEIELNKFLESEQCEEPDFTLLNKRKNALVLIQSGPADITCNSRESSCTLNEGQIKEADGKSAGEITEIGDQVEPMINRSIIDDSAIVVGSESAAPKASSISENPGSFASRRINATEQINRNMTTHSGG